MKKLTGGLKYCRMEGCENLTHPEDAPGEYPFCQFHPEANKSFWEMQKEKRHHEAINKELYET
jgi:hypothetical protein